MNPFTATIRTDAVGLTALVFIALAWIVFGLIFLLRKRAPRRDEVKHANQAWTGIILQGLSFGMVWNLRRADWWPFAPSLAGEVALAVVAVVMALGSSVWCLRSAQTLGKQWALQARVVAGHELIMEGPYHVVRNPIYLGMFGMMIATGLVISTWWALLLAAILFLIGNLIRIKEEERLLSDAFGSQFADYAKRVPAFLPRLW